MKAIQEAIVNKILDQEEAAIKPKFLGTIFKAGYMVINCEDEATEEWLIDVVPSLKPWEGTALRALRGKSYQPKTQVFNAYFPGSAEDNSEKILKFIRA